MKESDKLFRCIYEMKRRIRYICLKDNDISIITNNCLGGKLAHDFGLMLNSPVVNMQMAPEDFVQFCGNLDFYLKKQLEEVKEINEDCKEKFRSVGGGEIDFPVARLENIYLYLQHYHTFEEAYRAWERRKERIKARKFYILTVKIDQQLSNIEKFDELPLPNKLILTIDRPYQGFIKNSQYRCLNVPKGIHFMDRKAGSFIYYYESFPFLKWFNGEV